MPRVLIIKFGAIGDVIMAIPAAHELHCAGYVVDWVCGLQVLPLLQCYPWIQPIPVNERMLLSGGFTQRVPELFALWRRLLRTRYDLCATLYYDARYRVVALPVRAGRKLMLSHTDRLGRLLPGRHHTDEYLRVLLGRDDGPTPTPLAPVRPQTLPPSPMPRLRGRQRVILVPGGARNQMRSDGLRRWPVADYVTLAEVLLGQGFEVVLVGGPEDREAADAFCGMDLADQVNRLSLLETLALMEESDVVVTHDTGPLHLAGLSSAGIVTIFGPTDPRGRLPQRAGAVALWGGEGFACRPCYDGRQYASCGNNQCMQQVTPEMVVREISALLEQRRVGQQEPPRIVTPRSTVSPRWIS